MPTFDRSTGSNTFDLVILGGTASGLSVAISSLRSGLKLVRVIESRSSVDFPELATDNNLDVGYGEELQSIDVDGDNLVVTTDRLAYRTRSVLVANRHSNPSWEAPISTPTTLDSRIHVDEITPRPDEDILVVGHTDHAVELTATIAAAGARVVLAAGGMDPSLLSPAGEHMLRRLERERRATLLYRSVPSQIANVAGFPMAYFDDRHTPDLQFDQVVFASGRSTLTPADVGLSEAALATGRVFFVGEPDEDTTVPTSPGWRVGRDIAAASFPDLELAEPAPVIERRGRHTAVIEELRTEHYNATITHFEPTHSDLWVLRVRPDHGETSHQPGQYASLGLGFWEPRIDDAEDRNLDDRWDKLIRRSYSISSRMFDEHGYLTSEAGHNELEFYIVLVPPTPDNVPALTPRLALKRPGDRIYLGPKVAGRYTLNAVTDPKATVLFFGTGTGEAPHNGMVVELLRKGHTGPIVSAVSVRKWADLGYIDKHRELESRYPNYHYLPMPTRESDVPKRYIQSLITDDVFSKELGLTLDPTSTHVFLCGNPAMIGLPEGADGEEKKFPETVGVVQLLTEQGFKLDERRSPGNIHYEEYW